MTQVNINLQMTDESIDSLIYRLNELKKGFYSDVTIDIPNVKITFVKQK